MWGTSRRAGGQSIVVELDKPIDVASVAIDPGAGCGDDPTASLGQYELLGAPTADGPWTPLGAGTFGPQHIGQLNSVVQRQRGRPALRAARREDAAGLGARDERRAVHGRRRAARAQGAGLADRRRRRHRRARRSSASPGPR